MVLIKKYKFLTVKSESMRLVLNPQYVYDSILINIRNRTI